MFRPMTGPAPTPTFEARAESLPEKEEQMLHMIVNTHNPESCAFRSQEDGAALSDPFERFVEKVAGSHGVTIQGTWVNRPAHEIFLLADAPNSHAIEDALLEAGLVGRTHSRVLSVVPTQDVEVDLG